MKPFSEASERNRGPILEVLKRVFSNIRFVLEIGSGTGQHAAYFSPELPHRVFSANTCHIMSWPQVERMFAGVGRLLPAHGVFALYGPFNYGGRHTSESNARFDAMLHARDPASGLRDVDDIVRLAALDGLGLEEDNAMPANNRLLVFQKQLDQ